MARYILMDEDSKQIVDDNLDLASFCLDNAFEPWEIDDMLKRFEEGRPSMHGGGAAPLFSVLKVA